MGEAQEASDDRKLAFEYSWGFLKYHAEQRQSAFRFYLIAVGALGAAGVATTELFPIWALGIGFFLSSFLFWRLDMRNRDLVKIAEKYLKHEEQRISEVLCTDRILLLSAADKKPETNIIRRRLSSYTQIHSAIFLVVGGSGLFLAMFPLFTSRDWPLAIYANALDIAGYTQIFAIFVGALSAASWAYASSLIIPKQRFTDRTITDDLSDIIDPLAHQSRWNGAGALLAAIATAAQMLAILLQSCPAGA